MTTATTIRPAAARQLNSLLRLTPSTPVSQLPAAEKPREKLLAAGTDGMSERELLQVMIGSGVPGADVAKIADDIMLVMEETFGSPSPQQLMQVHGVSRATASRLVAGLELTARLTPRGKIVLSDEDVVSLLQDIRHNRQECFAVITLDSMQRVIKRRIVSIGTLNASLVHPREVFADAITDRAAAIIVAHNHPGGSLEPSGPDIVTTKRLRAAGELLGIKLLDHIIVTPDSHSIIEVD